MPSRITLEVLLQTERMRSESMPAVRLTKTNMASAAYWTPAHLVAHHTVNGCNLHPGDLMGSGTLSGPTRPEAGSPMELTTCGKAPIEMPNGERRSFLEDNDTLILRGRCEAPGAARIGLGEARGTVVRLKGRVVTVLSAPAPSFVRVFLAISVARLQVAGAYAQVGGRRPPSGHRAAAVLPRRRAGLN